MDENHQDKTGSKLIATGDKLWIPPLSPSDQNKLKRLPKKALAERIGFTGKTLWDWVPLLIQGLGALLIPIAIFCGTTWFSYQQNQTSLQIAQNNRQNDIQLANEQQKETVLKTYLDDMSDLLLNHHLRKSQPGDEVGQVAKERTLTTLRRLDANRNRIVLQFLQDAHLIGLEDTVIDLSNADLSGDELGEANLSGANLGGADLSGTHLSDATLSGADLQGTIMPDGTKHP
jgi:hypothetical protein